MTFPHEEDRGIETEEGMSTTARDDNHDGIVEDALGNPAAPEDSGAGD